MPKPEVNQYIIPEGSIVPVVTPGMTTENGIQVDQKGIEAITRLQVNGGSNGIFILDPTVGQSTRLTLNQQIDVVNYYTEAAQKIAEAENKPRIPILVGASSRNDKSAIKTIARLADSEADAVVLTPFFGEIDSGEQLRIVLEETDDISIGFNNNPLLHPEQGNIPPDIIEEHEVEPRFTFMIDNSGDQNIFNQYFKKQREQNGFSILQGSSKLLKNSKLENPKLKNPKLNKWRANGIVVASGNHIPSITSMAAEGNSNEINWIIQDAKELDRGDIIKEVNERLKYLGAIHETVVFPEQKPALT